MSARPPQGARVHPAWALSSLVACWLAVGACSTEPQPHVSVIVVVVDTLRADHLGAYGYDRATSPNLDRWAKKGRLFEHAHSTAPWTLPSFGSLYTGLFPLRHGAGVLEPSPEGTIRHSSLSARPVAEHLRARGVKTGAVLNNGFLGAVFGVNRGFTVYDHVPGSADNIRRANVMVDRALTLVDRWGSDPFFLVVHFFDPHLNYDPPKPFRGTFTTAYKSKMALPIRGLGVLRRDVDTLTEEDRKFVTAAYDEEVAFVDQQFGRLMEELEFRNLLGTTLVVLTSDHGEELFEHDGFEHGHAMWQELLHVPLVFWGPDVVPGREAAPVSLVDVAPTLLEWLDVEPLPSTDGISLWPNLSSEAPISERTLYAEGVLYGPARSAILRWPIKVVVDGDFRPIRAFDLAADPNERTAWKAIDPGYVTTLVEQMRTFGRSVESAQSEGDEVELDDEALKSLRSLGYIR